MMDDRFRLVTDDPSVSEEDGSLVNRLFLVYKFINQYLIVLGKLLHKTGTSVT